MADVSDFDLDAPVTLVDGSRKPFGRLTSSDMEAITEYLEETARMQFQLGELTEDAIALLDKTGAETLGVLAHDAGPMANVARMILAESDLLEERLKVRIPSEEMTPARRR